jgi:hypothetical protein
MENIYNYAVERNGKSLARNKKHQLRIDMTPMVDLGFLLITFFIFTTTLSTPTATDLFMPAEKPGPLQTLPKSLALTFLLDDNDRVFYYHGDFDGAKSNNEIFETGYSTYDGIGKIVRQKQKDIEASGKFSDGRKGLMLLIKPADMSSYKNIIDALDEAMINDVRKYALLALTESEKEFLKYQSLSTTVQ